MRISIFSLTAVAALMASPVLAQQVPGAADIQRVPERFDEPLQPLVTPEAPAMVAPPSEAETQDLEAVTFTLESVTVEGNTALPDERLAPIWEGSLGTEVSVADLYRMAREITAAYRDAGYIISRAIVPAQRIGADGAVRFQVVEGFVSHVTVEGREGAVTHRMEAMLRNIEGETPLNVETLERYLLLANDLSGVELESVLRPAPDGALGAAELVVTIERDRAAGYASVDNRGSDLLGPVQTELGGFLYNPLGWDASLAMRVIASSPVSEFQYGEISYTQPIGTDGTAIELSYLHAESQPSGILATFEIEGTTDEGTLFVTHPLIRSRLENLRLRAGFTVRHAETTAINNTELVDDDLRILSAGATYDWFDAWRGVNLLSADVYKGLDILGASDVSDPNLSRTRGRADFFKIEGEASRLQALGSGFEAYALAGVQWSPESLLASEEFGAGGDRYGRGYDPSEITGDSGAAFTFELRYNADLGVPYLTGMQAYAFFDTAAVWDNEVGADERRTLSSAGIGLRVEIAERASGFVEIAQPINRDIATRGDKDPRILGGVAVRF